MRIEELAAEYAHYIPGYELIHYEEIGFPVWRVIIKVQMLQDKSINIVDEFCLKLIDAGVIEINHIAKILGINLEIVKDSLVMLIQNDAIYYNNTNDSLNLTTKGRNVLKEMHLISPETVSFPFCIDSITGTYFPHDSRLLMPKAMRNSKYRSIHQNKDIEYPSYDNIEFKAISSLFKDLTKEGFANLPKGELLEIIDIEKVWPMFKMMRIFTYYRQVDEEYRFVVFDRNEIVTEYEAVLFSLENNYGIDILPFEKMETEQDISTDFKADYLVDNLKPVATENLHSLNKIEQELQKKQATIVTETISRKSRDELEKEIALLKEIEKDKNKQTRLLRTYEHRPLLEKSFEQAKKWVVIISPWLTSEAFDDSLMSIMDKALQRKVRVIILYGYPGNMSKEKQNNQTTVVDRLRHIQKRKHGKKLYFQDIKITHEKVLICDKSFIIVGSFNWLSFKGDKNRSLRLEKSIYTEDSKVIDDALNDVRSLTKEEMLSP